MAARLSTVHLGLKVEEDARTFKVVVLGETGVGKTSLATRLTDNPLSFPSSPTIGLNFAPCKLDVDDTPWSKLWMRLLSNMTKVRVHVWDTAGQERFHSLLPAYCRRSHGAIFVFDLTDLRSFLCLDRCMRWAEETLPDNTTKLLVGNKKDLADRGMRAVTSWMAQEWANQEDASYVELSMLETGTNVKGVFANFVRQLMKDWPPVDPDFDLNEKEAKYGREKAKCCV